MEEDHRLQGGSGIYRRVLRPVVKVKSGRKRGKKRGREEEREEERYLPSWPPAGGVP